MNNYTIKANLQPRPEVQDYSCSLLCAIKVVQSGFDPKKCQRTFSEIDLQSFKSIPKAPNIKQRNKYLQYFFKHLAFYLRKEEPLYTYI